MAFNPKCQEIKKEKERETIFNLSKNIKVLNVSSLSAGKIASVFQIKGQSTFQQQLFLGFYSKSQKILIKLNCEIHFQFHSRNIKIIDKMQTPFDCQSHEKLQFGEGPDITSVPESVFEKFKTGSMPLFSAFRLFSTDVSSEEDDQQSELGDNKTRGCYRKYSQQEKEQAVNKILNGCDVKQVSRQYGIPRRNLIRWRKNGCQRKEGGGRPTNQLLEAELYEKIKNRQINGQKEIRIAAISISKAQNFKASKGWFSKFSRRFKLITGEDLPKN